MSGHVPRVRARLALPAHRPVRGLLTGEYAAVQTGRGMEFNDLRPYVRGDDVRDLDWRASARSGQTLVRRYVAERKHTVLLVVSTGRSMAADHDVGVPKRDLAVLVAGLVGWLAVRHGDLVTLVHGDAERHHARPARGGELHLERCLGAVHDAIGLDAAPSDLAGLLRHVARTVRRRTILLVVCDDEDASPEVLAGLRRLHVQHEVLLVTVGDVDPTGRPPDLAADAPGAVDVDSRRRMPRWLGQDRRLHEEHRRAVIEGRRAFHEAVLAVGVAHQRVSDGDQAVHAVLRLLERHRHARR